MDINSLYNHSVYDIYKKIILVEGLQINTPGFFVTFFFITLKLTFFISYV